LPAIAGGASMKAMYKQSINLLLRHRTPKAQHRSTTTDQRRRIKKGSAGERSQIGSQWTVKKRLLLHFCAVARVPKIRLFGLL
jgi:hypothetical protein